MLGTRGVKQNIELNHKAEIMVSLFLLSACTFSLISEKMQFVCEDKPILVNFYFESHTSTQMVIKSKIQIHPI